MTGRCQTALGRSALMNMSLFVLCLLWSYAQLSAVPDVGKKCVFTHHCVVVPGRWADRLQLIWQIEEEVTNWSWDDRLHLSYRVQLSWQSSWQVELSWQQSGQVAAELTDCTWAKIWQLSWHITAKLTEYIWGDRLQLSQHVATEMPTFIWANRVQLSWRVAVELTAELTWFQLFQHVAAELTLTVPKIVQMVEKW